MDTEHAEWSLNHVFLLASVFIRVFPWLFLRFGVARHRRFDPHPELTGLSRVDGR